MNTFNYSDPVAKTLSPETMKALAFQLKQDVDAFCVQELTDEHRHHLGASVIGQECSRFVWYAFRWVKFEIFSGRMLRLFDRGNLEEARFIRWLRGAGCEVWDVDPQTNKQFRIWGVQGHYGGSTDAVGILKYLPDMPLLLEFKTHNTKSFSDLVNKGSVKLSKFRHYAQACAYGKHYGFKYAIYVATNKNDDDLYIEVIELDWNLAHDLMNKAQDIIEAKFPPPRISDQPSYYECKWCSFQDICHYGAKVEINCRSCKHATAVANAEWHCGHYNAIIPKEHLPKGCPNHVSITA